MEVNVLRWNAWTTPKTPSLRGFCKFLIVTPSVSFELNDVKYHENDTGNWLQLPSRPYENKDGETKFSSYFYFADRQGWDQFQPLALAALHQHMNGGPVARPVHDGAGPQVTPEPGQSAPGTVAAIPRAEPVHEEYDEIPF